ncbi:MAG TPA: 30S ribosomal protein S2 [Candidatus Paceibacterota bacterium]|nr:30S ribosomal protein S2 [Candidatus Paceibacterota bacterium]
MSTTNDNQNLVARLFAAGAHYGFSKSRRHPSVKPYLFGSKQGTDIFDLTKTAALLDDAKAALEAAGKDGKTVLFVSTKDETSRLVRQEAERAEAPYVINRWIGGMLTNFTEIKKRIDRLHQLTVEGESGELERKYTKKERVMIGREIDKLTFNFGGIKQLEKTPAMMVVIDPRHDQIAVREANDSTVPVVGIMSSDNDLSKVQYPVVANDALQASVQTILSELVDAYLAGKAAFVPAKPAAKTTTRRTTTPTTA